MQLRLKTKFTLTTALLVFAVAAVLSAAYVAALVSTVVRDARENAHFVARQILLHADSALADAAAEGRAPASARPEDVRAYLREALDEHPGLLASINAVIRYSPLLHEVTITDRQGFALVSSDASLPGRQVERRDNLDWLAEAGLLDQLRTIRGPGQVFELVLPTTVGDVHVALNTALLREQIEPRLRAAVWLALAAVLVSAALAAAVSHFSLAPLAKISAQLDRLSHGEFDSEPLDRRDEFGLVSSKISLLGRQLEQQAYRSREERSLAHLESQMQTLEHIAALSRVTAGAAHEVKNPLNSMRIWLENLKASLPAAAGEQQQALGVLDAEIDRLDAVVKGLLEFYRPVPLAPEPARLDALLGEVLDVVRPQAARAGVVLENSFAGDVPPARVDRALVKQAVMNLVLNALEATPAGGRVEVRLERRDRAARISVVDTGRGIPPEHREKIFRLFFTTRPGGSGIGLASVFKTVQLHGGSIDFTSEVGQGTTFRIELPLAE